MDPWGIPVPVDIHLRSGAGIMRPMERRWEQEMTMTRFVILCLAMVLIAGSATAQWFIDPFGYPPGTTIPGYTEQRGDWMATGSTVQSNAATTFQELTNDTWTDKDVCVETVAIYDMAAPNLMYTGPIARYTGSGASANFFMIKLQDNSSPRDGFDRWFAYFYNGSSFSPVATSPSYYADISPPTKRARVRLQVIEESTDVRVQLFLDTDVDGKWDATREWRSTYGIGSTGKIGICGYRNAIADDLKYFNATLYLADPPKVGNFARLIGRGLPNETYVGACSFGHSGFPVGPGHVVPLDLDPLFWTSLATPVIFQNFVGITSATGGFTMSLNIPPIPQLAGITIWSSAAVITANGFQEIAPDVEITIQS